MKFILLAIALASAGTIDSPFVAANDKPSEQCALEEKIIQEFFKMDFNEFDQNIPFGGWRRYSTPRCFVETGVLIDAYNFHHSGKLLAYQTQILTWHAGQMYGFGNMYEAAINRFERSYIPPRAEDPLMWNSYVTASIAFLKKDLPTLIAARDQMRAAKDSDKNVNLLVVESFVRCFDRPYSEACNFTCGKSQ